MEVKRINILPINKKIASNTSEAPVRFVSKKTAPSFNSAVNSVFQKKEQKIQKEFEKLSKNLDKFMERINEVLNPLNKELRVEIDRDLKIPVFKIIDKTTNEVIRQVPLEEILKLMKSIEKLLEKQKIDKSHLKGLLLKKEV